MLPGCQLSMRVAWSVYSHVAIYRSQTVARPALSLVGGKCLLVLWQASMVCLLVSVATVYWLVATVYGFVATPRHPSAYGLRSAFPLLRGLRPRNPNPPPKQITRS